MNFKRKLVLSLSVLLLTGIASEISMAHDENRPPSLGKIGIVDTSEGHHNSEFWNEKLKNGELEISMGIKPGSWADIGTDTWDFIGKDKDGNLYYTIGSGESGKEGKDEKEEKTPRKPNPKKPPKPEDVFVIERVSPSKVKWTRTTYVYDEASNSWKEKVTHGSAELTMSANIYDHQGKQKNAVTTKAGYGVQVDVKTKMIVQGDLTGITITENKGADAVTTYTVNKPKPQPKKIKLQKIDENTFVTGVNPLSKTKAKVIYTDTGMKNGSYLIEVKVFGVSVNGLDLSNMQKLSFAIKGSMYDDSYVRPTDEKKSKNNTGFKKFTAGSGSK